MIKKIPRRTGVAVLTVFCALLAGLLLWRSQIVGGGVRTGLRLCAEVVIPSLFPFMVLSGFLATSRVSAVLARLLRPLTLLLRLPQNAAPPLLMGLIGGYPVGARTLAVMVSQHRLSPRTASRMLCFCVNAGPPFLLCAVGAGMFGSTQAGLLLLAAQAASALLIGLVLGIFSREEAAGTPTPPQNGFRPYSVCLVQAVNDACAGMLSICSFVVLFAAAAALLSSTGIFALAAQWLSALFPALSPALLEAVFFGVLEVTTGCEALAACGFWGLLCAAALLSFSGLSVIFQVLAAVHGTGISVRGFLISRLFHGGLTLALFCLLLRVFPQAVQAAVSFSRPAAVTAGTAGGSFFLLAMCAVFLLQAAPRSAGSPAKPFTKG